MELALVRLQLHLYKSHSSVARMALRHRRRCTRCAHGENACTGTACTGTVYALPSMRQRRQRAARVYRGRVYASENYGYLDEMRRLRRRRRRSQKVSKPMVGGRRRGRTHYLLPHASAAVVCNMCTGLLQMQMQWRRSCSESDPKPA